jgi:hypothetical protein
MQNLKHKIQLFDNHVNSKVHHLPPLQSHRIKNAVLAHAATDRLRHYRYRREEERFPAIQHR